MGDGVSAVSLMLGAPVRIILYSICEFYLVLSFAAIMYWISRSTVAKTRSNGINFYIEMAYLLAGLLYFI
jgi:hypothetical protein